MRESKPSAWTPAVRAVGTAFCLIGTAYSCILIFGGLTGDLPQWIALAAFPASLVLAAISVRELRTFLKKQSPPRGFDVVPPEREDSR